MGMVAWVDCQRKNDFWEERLFHCSKRSSCQCIPIHHRESYHVHVINTANESASNQSVVSLQNTQCSLRTPLWKRIIEPNSSNISIMKCIHFYKFFFFSGCLDLASDSTRALFSQNRGYMYITVWSLYLYKMIKCITNISLWKFLKFLNSFRNSKWKIKGNRRNHYGHLQRDSFKLWKPKRKLLSQHQWLVTVEGLPLLSISKHSPLQELIRNIYLFIYLCDLKN